MPPQHPAARRLLNTPPPDTSTPVNSVSSSLPCDGPSGATQSDGPIDGTQSDVTRAGAPGGSNKKPVKEPKKKKRDDPMVKVMANYVEIKQMQAQEESALFAGSKNAQQFTISKCIAVLHKMEIISHGERVVAYKVFKNAENREIFLNAAVEDEGNVTGADPPAGGMQSSQMESGLARAGLTL
ncbi:hypothetical protein D1007_04082 [Hordeum vulgare]|nr:hypothetical protein D1007_04082 [Hordeum vulgare]